MSILNQEAYVLALSVYRYVHSLNSRSSLRLILSSFETLRTPDYNVLQIILLIE
jgi:hypothetical protein